MHGPSTISFSSPCLTLHKSPSRTIYIAPTMSGQDVVIPHASELLESTETSIAHDFGLIFGELCTHILARARVAMHRDKTSFTMFNVCDQLDVKNRQTRIKYITFFRGFWNRETRTHETDRFKSAGVERMMLEELQRCFEPKGYSIEDISRSSLSFNHVLMVTMHNTP